jgi:hypothetical protein
MPNVCKRYQIHHEVLVKHHSRQIGPAQPRKITDLMLSAEGQCVDRTIMGLDGKYPCLEGRLLNGIRNLSLNGGSRRAQEDL